ncbi:ATP phosphoribosyltransferase [Actinopolyspora mortivallis]|nr:ATP phosphoribosyltransferase [Actinopolyspora mortivallis]
MLTKCTVEDFHHLGKLEKETRVVFGVPNSGRLLAEVVTLIGPLLDVNSEHRGLLFESEDMVVICARSYDLPKLAERGMADIILTGYDYVVDSGVELEEIYDTGFQQCTIGIVGVKEKERWRQNKSISVATQYPGIACRFFENQDVPNCSLFEVSGAAELYAQANIVDIIVDAYMTGETAKANGLCLLEPILKSSGRIFARPGWRQEDKDIGPVIMRLIS